MGDSDHYYYDGYYRNRRTGDLRRYSRVKPRPQRSAPMDVLYICALLAVPLLLLPLLFWLSAP